MEIKFENTLDLACIGPLDRSTRHPLTIMGFGPCEVKEASRFVRRPKGSPLSQEVVDNHVYCEMFRWSATSAVIKTACLALFFVVESPRRVIAYAARRPEVRDTFPIIHFGTR